MCPLLLTILLKQFSTPLLFSLSLCKCAAGLFRLFEVGAAGAALLSFLIFQLSMQSDAASKMWNVRRVLSIVNLVVNPECISKDPTKG